MQYLVHYRHQRSQDSPWRVKVNFKRCWIKVIQSAEKGMHRQDLQSFKRNIWMSLRYLMTLQTLRWPHSRLCFVGNPEMAFCTVCCISLIAKKCFLGQHQWTAKHVKNQGFMKKSLKKESEMNLNTDTKVKVKENNKKINSPKVIW